MIALLRLVALRHLRLAPLRSLLTLLGIAISVSAIVAVSGANKAVLGSFRGTIEQLSGKVDLEVGDGEAPIPMQALDRISKIAGISHASPVVSTRTRHKPSNELMLVLGVDLTGDDYFRDYTSNDASELDPIEFLNCANCVMLSAKFAAAHGIAKKDLVTFTTQTGAKQFLVKAIMKDEGAALAFGGNVVVMYLDAAQLMFDREDRYDRIDLAVTPGVSRQEVIAAIGAALPEGVPIDEPKRRGERTERMLQRFQTAIELASGVALLVAMFMIYNTMGIAVAQRRREIGILRALGVTDGEVKRLFVGEALVLGAIGSALGVMLGRLLSAGVLRGVNTTVSNLYTQLKVSDSEVSGGVVALSIGLGTLATAVSAYFPAMDASRTPPAMSMSRDASRPPPLIDWRRGVVISLCLWVLCYVFASNPVYGGNPWPAQVSLLFALLGCAAVSDGVLLIVAKTMRGPLGRLLGVPGILAADNMRRQGGRAVLTVAALMVGTALGFGSATFTNGFQYSIKAWIDQSVPADLFVTASSPLANQSNSRLPGSLFDELSSIPGVAGALEGVVIRRTVFDDLRVGVLGVDLALRLRHAKMVVLDGDPELKAEQLSGGRRVLVSENLAFRKKLKAGDSISLNTPTGTHRYEVRAVYVDYTSDQGTILFDRSVYQRDYLDETIDTFELYLPDVATRDRVRAEISQRFAERYDLFVLTNAEFRAELEKVIRQSFSATRAMSIIAILVALLGVVNTLFAAVIDRTRELGVLRAIGMSRAQILLTLVLEGALLGVAAIALGYVGGGALGYIFVEVANVYGTGFHVGYHPPYAYQAVLGVCSLIAAALAAAWPAWRAVKLKLVSALGYE